MHLSRFSSVLGILEKVLAVRRGRAGRVREEVRREIREVEAPSEGRIAREEEAGRSKEEGRGDTWRADFERAVNLNTIECDVVGNNSRPGKTY